MAPIGSHEIDLPDSDIHVWRALLDRAAAEMEHLARTLTPDEKERAGRFRFQRDRSWFIARRGLLRVILGRYLGGRITGLLASSRLAGALSPNEPFPLPFDLDQYGKPRMPDGMNRGDLRFNVSHSAGVALFAVTRGREVGVDIEAVRSDIDYRGVAESFFSPAERESLAGLPADQRRDAFFTCWARKEAYIKARGMGLSLPLDSFDVTLGRNEPARLLATRGDLEEASRWSIQTLRFEAEYAGAVVAQGHNWRTILREWPDTY